MTTQRPTKGVTLVVLFYTEQRLATVSLYGVREREELQHHVEVHRERFTLPDHPIRHFLNQQFFRFNYAKENPLATRSARARLKQLNTHHCMCTGDAFRLIDASGTESTWAVGPSGQWRRL